MTRTWTVTLSVMGTLAALAFSGPACTGDEEADPCVKAHPRGMEPISSNDALVQALSECSGDSGECRASTACQGAAADRVCEIAPLISAEAARCVAQGNGLEMGIDRVRVSLVYNYVYRRITWNVNNVTYDASVGAPPPGSNGQRGGQSFLIDAISAKMLAKNDWASSQ
jgi:hypothetical protein